uniref:RanBP2-type domain-containing protein n=1 Tax=Grammatophora oceanica TaxID=210454 RepID=A0A7S1VQ98_9STRA|mmetsp:Transcript_51106/g.76344  ORF Transcript_51106/g.76344 Transcript_51106/m.76344 type:complete len:855 (+) Transcript_51106:237-2801(+)
MVKPFSKSIKGSWRKGPTRKLASRSDQDLDPANRAMCYSGIQEIWEDGPVVVWGDFPGARIYPSVDKLDEFKTVAQEHDSGVSSILVLPEAKTFLLGCKSGSLLTFLVTKEPGAPASYQYDLVASTPTVGEVCGLSAISLAPLLVASATAEGVVNLHTGMGQKEGEEIFRVDGKLLAIKAFDFHGPKVVTGDATGNVCVWGRGIKKDKWMELDCFQLPEEQAQPVRIEARRGTKGTMTVLVGDDIDTVSVLTLDSSSKFKRRQNKDIHMLSVGGPTKLLSVIESVFLSAGNDQGRVQAWSLKQDETAPTQEKMIKCVDDLDAGRNGPIVGAIPSQKYGTMHCLRQDGSVFKWNFVDDNALNASEAVASPHIASVPSSKQQLQLPTKRRYTPAQSNEQEMLWNNETWGELPDVDDLANLMEHGSARDCDRMRMHIVRLCFLDYWDKDKNGCRYGLDLVFNLHSGLDQCTGCKEREISAYDCRLGYGHNEDLPNTYLSTLYRKCHDSGPKFCAPGRGKGKKAAGKTWFCTRCNDENKDANKRCTLCQKWRDGKRTNNLIWPRDKSNKKKKQPPKTVKMWECSRCSCWNSFLKCDCTGCGQQGGTVIFVPTSEVEEMKVKDVSTSRSGPRWTCPHCHHNNKQSRTYCEECTEPKKDGTKMSSKKKARKEAPKDSLRELAPPPTAAAQSAQSAVARATGGILGRPSGRLLRNIPQDPLELRLTDQARLREAIAVEQQMLARQLLGGGLGSLLANPGLAGAASMLGLGGFGGSGAGGNPALGGLAVGGLDPYAARLVASTWKCIHCRNQNLDQIRTCVGCGQLRIEGGNNGGGGRVQALSNQVQDALAKYGQKDKNMNI